MRTPKALTMDESNTIYMLNLHASGIVCNRRADSLYPEIAQLARLKAACEQFLAYPIVRALDTSTEDTR